MVGVWGNSVVDARGVRSLPIFGAGSGSSPHVRKQKNARLDVRASAREPDRICLLRERRTAALNVDAERMLIGASLRASKRLRSTRPPLSAATLSWRASCRPFSWHSLLLPWSAPSCCPFLLCCLLRSVSGSLYIQCPLPRRDPPAPKTSRSPSTASSLRSAAKHASSINCCRQSND